MEHNSLPNLSALSLRQEATAVNTDPTYGGIPLSGMRYGKIVPYIDGRKRLRWAVTIFLKLGATPSSTTFVPMRFIVGYDKIVGFTATWHVDLAPKMGFSETAWPMLRKFSIPDHISEQLTKGQLFIQGTTYGTPKDFHRAILVAMGMPDDMAPKRIFDMVGPL